jgi:hypothetical protein
MPVSRKLAIFISYCNYHPTYIKELPVPKFSLTRTTILLLTWTK